MLCRADLGRPCRQANRTTPLSPCGPNVLSASTLGRCRPPACSQAELSVDANPSFFSSTGARAWPCLLLADHCVWPGRSEEHTSELQSLMRISYAVFCLKKKKRRRHKQ